MDWILFLAVLAQVESNNNPKAVGDLNRRHKAYGLYQIRQPYLDDVNNIFGKTLFSAKFKMSDMVERPGAAGMVVSLYISHYGKLYTMETGKPLTVEIAARIHNGGPNGWKKRSTDQYWEKFKKQLEVTK